MKVVIERDIKGIEVYRKITEDNLLSYQEIGIDDDLFIQAIRDLVNGNKTHLYYQAMHLLVTHGEPGSPFGGFYPLPLLFSSSEERIASAKEANKAPPPERWVKRKANHLKAKLGIS